MRHIYLDHSATTKMSSSVIEAMIDSFNLGANPSSLHKDGQDARRLIEKARKNVADLIGAESDEIIFTSGATESNNTVIGIAETLINQSNNELDLIISSIEHPSIIEPTKKLGKSGITIHYIPVDRNCRIDIAALKQLLDKKKTALVSVMAANNETGTIQEIEEITKLAHASGALMHTDIVQAAGKIPLNIKKLDVDYASLSAHKINGPKGIGALYIKKGAPFYPFMLGGHQENGLRATTYNTQGIVGFGQACKDAACNIQKYKTTVEPLKNYLRDQLVLNIPAVSVNGDQTNNLPNVLNISFAGAEGESILLALDNHGIEVSTGSACASGDTKPSHVLMAMKADPELAHGSVRFSFGLENTKEDVDYVISLLPKIIKELRSISTVTVTGE
jgi:cysteine desulfurase